MRTLMWTWLFCLFAACASAQSRSNVNLVGITPPTPSTGTLSTATAAVTSGDVSGYAGIGVQITGTCGGCIAVSEGSSDGANWFSFPVQTTAGATTATFTTAGFWQGSIVGLRGFRVRMTAITSGAWVVTLKPTVSGTPSLTAVTVQNTNTGTNAAASTTAASVPTSADYQGVNVGGTLTGQTGLALGSQVASTVAIVDGSGNQVTSFGGAGGTASNVNSALPSVGTAVMGSDGTNSQIPRVFDADTGGGTQYVQGAVLRKSASGGSVEAGTSTDPLRVDPTGTTPQPATQSGTWNIGTVTTVSSVTSATVVGNAADAAADSGNPVKVGAVYTTATPTYTNGQRGQARIDASGNLLVNVAAGSAANSAASATGAAVPANAGYTGFNVGGTLRGGTAASLGSTFAQHIAIVDGSGNQVTTFGGSGGTASNVASAVPAQATYAGFSDGTNMQGARVFDADSGGGTQYVVGVQLRATGSGGSTEIGTAAAPIRTDPTGTTTQPVSGTVTANAAQSGTWNVNQAGTWTVQPGNTANTTPWLVKLAPLTPVLEAALSTTVQTVTGSAAVLGTYFCANPGAAWAYVQIFDVSGAVTLGSTAPKQSYGIPPGGAGNLADMNMTFANAIKIAATTTATGAGAPATALDCNFGYRAP